MECRGGCLGDTLECRAAAWAIMLECRGGSPGDNVGVYGLHGV